MPVVSTSVIDGPDVQVDGQHRGTIQFVFHNDDIVNRIVMAPDAVSWAALPANLTPEVEESVAQSEIEQWIQEMEAGGDPWHTIPFVNSTPEHNTWDVAAAQSLRHWLLMTDPQQLLNCKLSSASTSNKDLDDVLTDAGSGWTNTDLRGEIQIATDAQVRLDNYVPSVTE